MWNCHLDRSGEIPRQARDDKVGLSAFYLCAAFYRESSSGWTWLSLPVDASEHLTKSLAEMEMPERLHGASWEEVLLDLVPSWVEKGTIRIAPRSVITT